MIVMMPRIGNIFLGLIAVVALLLSVAAGQAPERKVRAAGEPILEAQEKAAIIHLDAEVDDVMLRSIQRRVEMAQRLGCGVIVFEVDTFGGQVTSAIEISKLIKSLPEKKIVTVAWVHEKAYSAGAMITASCQHVVMSGEGSYGLCAPIAVATSWTGGHELVPLPAAERAKMQDPVTGEFDDSAARNHWDPALLRAMVVVEAEVHELRRKNTGETTYVDTAGKEKLLALEEAQPDGSKFRPWEYVRTVDDDKSLLTVTAEQGLKMGLSEGTAGNDQQLKAALNVRGEIFRMEFNWAERATVFLTTFMIRFFLFVGLLVFAWLEFSHPGFSVFGAAALVCLGLLVGAPFLTGLAQVWEIGLIVVGLAIILVDLLVFGGVGMLAVPGFILMAIGLVASFVPAEPGGGFAGSHAAWVAVEQGLTVVVGGSFAAMIAFYYMAKYLHMTPGFNRLQLAPGGGKGKILPVAAIRDEVDRDATEAVFKGAIGRAASDLRPAGKARFGEHLMAVVSDGSFIPQGAEVIVIETSPMKVVVKPYVQRG